MEAEREAGVRRAVILWQYRHCGIYAGSQHSQGGAVYKGIISPEHRGGLIALVAGGWGYGQIEADQDCDIVSAS